MTQRARQDRRRVYLLGGPALYWLLFFLFLPLMTTLAISVARRGDYGVVRFEVWPSDYRHWLSTPQVEGEETTGTPGTPAAPTVRGYLAYVGSNYVRAFEKEYLIIYGRSFWLAGVTTVLCLLIGYPVAYFIAVKAPTKWRNPLLMLVVIPFWTSFLVRTYAWILILRTEGVVNAAGAALHGWLVGAGFAHLAAWIAPPWSLLYNDFAVLMGLIYAELPYMILPLYASIQKLDLSLLEAAQDLGAGPARAFWRITLPLTYPGIVAGVIFVFIPSIGAFIIPDLLGGSKSMMVGNLVQNQFASTRDYPFGAAVSFLLTALVFLLLWANSALGGGREEAAG